jgi:hypothetical protein
MIIFSNQVEAFPSVKTFFGSKYTLFKTTLAKEEALTQRMHKSEYTKQIAEADQRVDHCISSINEIIVASTRHPQETVRTAAYSLKVRLDEYGRIQRKSYEAETLAVDMLLSDLQSDAYSSKVTLLGLTVWVNELTAAETAFQQLFATRQDETEVKPKGSLTDIRREIDPQYHELVEMANAASIVGTVTDIDAFISKVNVDVDYFNEHYVHLTKKDLGAGDHTVVEPIETQSYTGEPITIIPRVHYREEGAPTEKLELGKDFTTTYKNNVNVGMAELTIHGKGAYKGQVVVTFNIAR